MKKRKNKFALFILIGCGLSVLSGCAEVPEMSEDETRKISQYASGLLLKYDAHNIDRLVGDDQIEKAYAQADRKAKVDYEVELLRAQKNEQTSSEESDSSSVSGAGTSEGLSSVSYSIEEILGIEEDFSLKLNGYTLEDGYYYDYGDDIVFSEKAGEGNEIVQIHFQLTNITNEEKECDILDLDPGFTLRIDEQQKYLKEYTMMLDDLAQYKETIAAGETKEVSLYFEVPIESINNMQTISLRVKNADKSNVFALN